MSIETATVVLVGVLCLVNMLFTFGVVRRLREHSQQLSRLPTTGSPLAPPDRDAVVGQTFPQLTVTAVDGTVISRDDVVGRLHRIGLFAAGCAPCHEQAPRFAAHADGAELVVIAGTGSDADELAALFDDGPAIVVAGSDGRRLSDALGVRAFPSFLQLDADGAIVRAYAEMPEPAQTAST